MKVSTPQKLTYRATAAHATYARRFDPPANAKSLNALWTYIDPATHDCLMWFCGDSVRLTVRRFPLPSHAHLLAPKPRQMLWSVRYFSGYTPYRLQPYRPVELVTFAPVHGFFHGINRHRNGNYLLTIIRHRNEFNPAASRCTY
ncbi:hypothetical protein HA052_04020 [Chromobacterium haemolyticum]|uniref:Uncharacterized protein n=1 Tax=Chromobacterium fluminis TaxID=3044269 RepID=A0ABX0KXU2_9NEIS|nr:hypothetical protein [Chromobacterium haemolyticum]NHR04357.1 hypothetical protein [Chromobacterium haemolyticum]